MPTEHDKGEGMMWRTMSERIEAAALAFVQHSGYRTLLDISKHRREFVAEQMKVALSAAFPELVSDPPTAWLAPVEPDERMKRLGAAAMWDCRGVTGYDEAAKIYSDMRIAASEVAESVATTPQAQEIGGLLYNKIIELLQPEE